MKRLSIYIFLFATICWNTATFAQADISMATHWYNRANYNPASIVRPDYIYLFSNVQKQWVGVSGSPAVFNVQASEFIHDYHSAFGISLVSDQIGVTQAINPMLTYAYKIGRNDDWWISLGLAAGIFSRAVDGSLFEAGDVNDDALYTNLEKITRPDANVGIEFQSTHFVLGCSSTHLFSIAKADSVFLNTNHVYGYAIYKNTDSELFNYNLGLQLVSRRGLTILEGNASMRFKHPTGLSIGPREIFDLGLTYRTSRQMSLLFGLNITNNFRVGYVYNQSFSVGYNANSTHEFMLEYRIPSQAASACHCKNLDYWYY
jgi:type IX secretion system PorP/SprF family membrane protein